MNGLDAARLADRIFSDRLAEQNRDDDPGSEPGPVGLVVTEFTDWEITVRPGGLSVVTAYWTTEDGRHRRYIVAWTAAELLDRLRSIRHEDQTVRR
jgi:hypothetical protein